MSQPQPSGIVYLVGAGPGDVGLITVRGAKLLEHADIVVYDALANPRLLNFAANAEAVYVGKRAAQHALPQDQINALLIDRARAGKRVVRLKGGDPFVFGRGGEECLALAHANIPFEIVPGITAAIAAAAYAGIPVTHRDLNSSFTLITGHEKEDAPSNLPWPAIAQLPCIAFYMAAASLPQISRRLIDNGMSPNTPAAMIQWGTTPQQKTVVSTLADLPTAAAALASPAITLVGKVVELRSALNWFENRPLFGQTIVVTRTRQQASELSEKLESLGAAVIEAPTIELAPAADPAAVDAAILSASTFDWIIFTSANGVSHAKSRLIAHAKDSRIFGSAKIAAIGDATAAAIQRELFLNVDLCPQQFIAEALADALISTQEAAGKKFLLLRADIARPILREKLIAAGAASVADIPLYQTLPAKSLPEELPEQIASKKIHWITFTSASTVRNFLALLPPSARAALSSVNLASIGPITTQALREHDLTPTVQAQNFNVAGLVDAILSHPRPV
jgi:uroporphyrinogen III methyltransferase/synthase